MIDGQTADPARTAASGAAGASVRRRRTFYIHGFDPRGPGPYHRMFSAEALRQARVSQASYVVGPRDRIGRDAAAWDVRASFGGAEVSTRFVFLRWDGEVRRQWSRGGAKSLAAMCMATYRLWRGGVLAAHWRAARPAGIAMILPLASLSVWVMSSAAVAAGVAVWVLAIAGGSGAPAPLAGAAGLAAAGAIGLAALFLWRLYDSRMQVGWLGRSLDHITKAYRPDRPACPRLASVADRFADAIVEAAADPELDEVLVVGHSSGAPVAVMALARAIRRLPGLGGDDSPGPPVSLLTLGQVATACALGPAADGIRSDLRTVAAESRIAWLDVASPSDGASSCGMSPIYGLDCPRGPARRSPLFHEILEPVRFRRVRLRPFDYHFLYLAAGDRAGGYDYFRLTCGPDRLADFANGWTAFVEELA